MGGSRAYAAQSCVRRAKEPGLIILFFIYGLAFFALGLVLLVRRPPSLIARLSRAYGLIGWFAVVHSAAEWLMMGDLIAAGDAPSELLDASLVVGGLSFIILALAAGEVAAIAWKVRIGLVRGVILSVGSAWGALTLAALSGHLDLSYSDIFARWLLGGPSALAIGAALTGFYRHRALLTASNSLSLPDGDAQMDRAFRALFVSGVLLGLYGASTFFGARLEVFPFDLVNAEAFRGALGVDPPLLRTIIALLLLVASLWFVTAFADLERRGMEEEIDARTTDLVEANRNLGEAIRKVEEANQAKSAFLATMSHELRTPLNAILGFSEVIAGQYFGPPGEGKYAEYARDIKRSGEHLLALVNDLLDISAIEAGERHLKLDEIEVEAMVSECFRIIERMAAEKNLTLRKDVARDVSPLHADERAAKQIFLNLLSNAAKFTPAGGEIMVSVAADRDLVRITVADNGIGMSAEQVEAATNPFVRGVYSPHVSENGWGLGLAIVQSLVALHDGALSIESEAGRGTRVIVTLPREREGAAARGARAG